MFHNRFASKQVLPDPLAKDATISKYPPSANILIKRSWAPLGTKVAAAETSVTSRRAGAKTPTPRAGADDLCFGFTKLIQICRRIFLSDSPTTRWIRSAAEPKPATPATIRSWKIGESASAPAVIFRPGQSWPTEPRLHRWARTAATGPAQPGSWRLLGRPPGPGRLQSGSTGG